MIIAVVVLGLVLIGTIIRGNIYTQELLRELENNGKTIDKLMENINLLNDKYRGVQMNVKDSIRRIDMIMLEMGTLQERRGGIRKVTELLAGSKSHGDPISDVGESIIKNSGKSLALIQNNLELKKKLIHKIISEVW